MVKMFLFYDVGGNLEVCRIMVQPAQRTKVILSCWKDGRKHIPITHVYRDRGVPGDFTFTYRALRLTLCPFILINIHFVTSQIIIS